MTTRRNVVKLLMSVMLATSSRVALGAEPFTQFDFMIGNPANSTIDQVGRALAEALRNGPPSRNVAVRNEGAASGRVALAECAGAMGQSNRMVMLPGGIVYTSFAEDAGFADDLDRVFILGSIGIDRRALFVTERTGVKTFEDLLALDRSLIAPATSAAASGFIEAKLLNAIAGTRLQPVGGFSSAERKLALLSGEADAVVGSLDTFNDLVENGSLRPLLRLNDAGPQAPSSDLPLLRDFAVTAESQLYVDLIEATAHANSLIVSPPGLSPDQQRELEAIFESAGLEMQRSLIQQLEPAVLELGSGDQTRARLAPVLTKRDALQDAFARAMT